MRSVLALVVAGLVVTAPTVPAVAGAAKPHPQGGRTVHAASGPTIDRVSFEDKVVKRETGLTEEQDFVVLVKARILPGPRKRPIEPASIKVFFRGELVEVGQRTFDPKTGAFSLTIDSEAHMALIRRFAIAEAQGKKPELQPVIVITASDADGRTGSGHYDAPEIAPGSARIEVYAGWTDQYGRSHRGDDRAASPPPPHPVGRPISLVGPPLDERSPLRLRLAARQAFPEAPLGAKAVTKMVSTPEGHLGLVRTGTYQTTLTRLEPASGKVLGTQALMAPPKGQVTQVRWDAGRMYHLAKRSGRRFVVEAREADRRVVVPSEPRPITGGYVDDFALGQEGVLFTEYDSSEPSVAACGWDGVLRWRFDTSALFPGTSIHGSMTHLSFTPNAASALAFMSGNDYEQPDEPTVVGVAEVDWAGKILASRLMVVPPSADRGGVDGGAAATFQGRRLMVVNTSKVIGEDVRFETAVYDMDARAAEPILVVPRKGEGTEEVFGAVVLHDRLVIACGSDGYAVLAGER